MRSFLGGAVSGRGFFGGGFLGGAVSTFAAFGITIMACSSSDDAAPGAGTDAGVVDHDGGPDANGPDAPPEMPAPDGGVSPTYVPFDINHVLVTGQSNETGNDATTILSTAQPYGNLMFDTGPMSMAGGFEYDDRGRRRQLDPGL